MSFINKLINLLPIFCQPLPLNSISVMINSQNFIDNFLAAVDFQEPVEVTLTTLLKDLPEWDSLASLGVIVMFDLEYGKTITGDDIDACVSLQDLMNLLG
jgi:acyl carrier protein